MGPSVPLNDMPESSNLSNDELLKKYKHLAPHKIMINFRVTPLFLEGIEGFIG